MFVSLFVFLVQQMIDGVPDLARLRLSSLDPARLDDDFFALLGAQPRLMPHLHLSLQAAEDMVLKRMKRRHLVGDVKSLVKRARLARPGVVFGADLIAGFPTETDDMFETTLANIKAMGLQYLHVFPYSTRPGTAAERMPQVPGPIAKARAKRLRQLGDDNLSTHLQSLCATTQAVLVEKPDFGRTETFASTRNY